MKIKHCIHTTIIALCTISSCAQSTVPADDTGTPKIIVEKFFKAFHQQDTTALRSFVLPGISMKSVGLRSGKTTVSNEAFKTFLISIAAIPESVQFEEILKDYVVHSDGLVATVSTPYTFKVNNTISHTGTNIFVMINTNTGWKISSITDSRSY